MCRIVNFSKFLIYFQSANSKKEDKKKKGKQEKSRPPSAKQQLQQQKHKGQPMTLTSTAGGTIIQPAGHVTTTGSYPCFIHYQYLLCVLTNL